MSIRRLPLAVAVSHLVFAAAIGPAAAGALQVAPVLVDQSVEQPAAAITLRDAGDRPVAVQLRVFRWVQEGGEDRLIPTDEVVASPPMTQLRPRSDYVVRIVRQSRRPVEGEDSYRLIVDELPDPALKANGGVALLVRQSIPVFFSSPRRAPPDVRWRIVGGPRGAAIEGTNLGDRRMRVSDLAIADGHGNRASFGPGLKGYVLGHSSIRWTLPQSGGTARLAGPLFLTAQTEGGPIRVPLDAARP